MNTLYINATIITVDEKRRVFRNGFILVGDDRILAIDSDYALQNTQLPEDVRKVDLERKIVIPGLINGHVHLIQALMRGLAEDMDLHTWASCAIWPLEVAYEKNDGYISARLAMAEMLKSGTTCFLEPMLPASAGFEGVCRAVEETGIRACLGKLVKVSRSDSTAGIVDARDLQAGSMTIESAILEHDHFNNSCNGRLNVWMAAETPRGSDEQGFAAIGRACIENDIRLTVHCAETSKDFKMIRNFYNATPAQFCENVRAVGPHAVLAHMVHLDHDVDFEILVRTATNIVHNPTSNAKLADGIAPIPELLSKGVNVCIGSDGAPCNNTHDLFRDMHLAGIIHKAKTQDSSILPSEQVLEMATINGARALGLDKDVGSLEVGKKADFVVINPTGLHASPYDPDQVGEGGLHPATVVVHCCTGQDVDMVLIDGEVLVKNGALVRLDEGDIKRTSRTAIAGIRSRSRINAQPCKQGWYYV